MRKAYSRPWGSMVALALAALLGAAACGDTDERPATWSYVYATIIQPNCTTSRCHADGAMANGWSFSTKKGAYDTFVGEGIVVPDDIDLPASADTMELMLAITGYEKLERMPPDEPLPDGDIALIRKWLQAGAHND